MHQREAGKSQVDSLRDTREAPEGNKKGLVATWEAPRRQGGRKGIIGHQERDDRRRRGGASENERAKRRPSARCERVP